MALRDIFTNKDDLNKVINNSISNTIRIPDYSAGVSLNVSQETYTAPKDGIICLYHVFGSVNYSKDITINGAFFARLKSWYGAWAGSAYSLVITVNEGDIVAGLPTLLNTHERPKRAFYPLKTILRNTAKD